MQAGQLTGDQANRLANDIRSGYGYTIDKLGNVTDLGVSSTIAARRKDWGLPTGSLNADQQKFLELMYPELGTKDPSSLLSAQSALHQGTYEPMQMPSYGGISGGSSGSMGGGFGDFDMDNSAFQYLKDLYAQQIAAELAALKSSYDQNMAEMNAQDSLISSEYDRQRNQLAAQNDLQRMQMNEMGILQGLNTGATGQMALAQNVALQGGLAQLGSQESQSLADVALQRAKLAAQYRSASDQVAAQGNAQLAGALYDEYVRQQQMAWQDQQAIQEQQRWEQQFAYQKMLDQRDYDLALQKLAGQSFDQGATGGGASGTGGGKKKKRSGGGYSNGGLSRDQVRELQRFYGVSSDGLWGAQSKKASGGKTADQALRVLRGLQQQIGMNRTQEGRVNALERAVASGQISEAQAKYLLQGL